MKAAIAFACVMLAAAAVQADPYQIAIQQAKRANDQNTAEQNRLQQAEGGSGAAGAGNAGAAVDPAMQVTLQNISSLQKDIVALNGAADADAAADQKIALLNDLTTAAQGTKAQATSVRMLAKDLMTALTNKKVPAAQQTKLARFLHAMFNSAHLTPTQQQTILDGVQKILTDAGVSTDAATDVVTDLKLVAADTK